MDKRKSKETYVPVKYYTNYKIERIGGNKRLHAGLIVNQNKVFYRVTANYFVFKGNVLSDSVAVKTEEFKVNGNILEQKKNMLDNAVAKTKKAFQLELQMIGASPRNALIIMKSRGL
jgi:hypothetical protein